MLLHQNLWVTLKKNISPKRAFWTYTNDLRIKNHKCLFFVTFGKGWAKSDKVRQPLVSCQFYLIWVLFSNMFPTDV